MTPPGPLPVSQPTAMCTKSPSSQTPVNAPTTAKTVPQVSTGASDTTPSAGATTAGCTPCTNTRCDVSSSSNRSGDGHGRAALQAKEQHQQPNACSLTYDPAFVGGTNKDTSASRFPHGEEEIHHLSSLHSSSISSAGVFPSATSSLDKVPSITNISTQDNDTDKTTPNTCSYTALSSENHLVDSSSPDLRLSSEYWDLPTMAPLNPRSLSAISRLQRYLSPNFPLWHSLPACRRAGVLVLLYPDQTGDLRVVLTMRAAGMRNFSGHAAFPGGKADDTEETPYEIARREAWEEIGLPQANEHLPQGYGIKQLCYLPHALARTDVVVRPCVAILDRIQSTVCPSAPAVEDALKPTPQEGEVAAVFSAPLHNFLVPYDEAPNDGSDLPPGPYYTGHWSDYDGTPWRVHNFYVPITNQRVTKPTPHPFTAVDPALEHEKRLAQNADVLEEHPGRYKVWGMTAKILVETARLAYAETPAFEYVEEFGDENLAINAGQEGRFFDRQRRKQRPSAGETVKKNIAQIIEGWRGGSGRGQESAKM